MLIVPVGMPFIDTASFTNTPKQPRPNGIASTAMIIDSSAYLRIARASTSICTAPYDAFIMFGFIIFFLPSEILVRALARRQVVRARSLLVAAALESLGPHCAHRPPSANANSLP